MSPQAQSLANTHLKATEMDAGVNTSSAHSADEHAGESSAAARNTDHFSTSIDDLPFGPKPAKEREPGPVSETSGASSYEPVEAEESSPTSAKVETVESPQTLDLSELQEKEQDTDAMSHPEELTRPVSSDEPDRPVEQVATAPTKPLDLVPSQQEDSELSLAVESPSPSEDDTVQTLHLDDMEATAVADNLLNEKNPSSAGPPSSPQPSNVRMSSALPFVMPRTPPLQWTPSKSRKVSLRTATLLKRSAQYPLVPLSEMRAANQNTAPMGRSPVAPRISTGSRDMDMTRDFGGDASSDSDTSSEDEDEIDRSLGSSGSGPEFERPKTPEPKERAPVLTNFLTPQQPKQRMLRRMSNPDAPSTPKLKSRSSWQWLRDLFKSPTTKDERRTDVQPSEEEKDSSRAQVSELLEPKSAAPTANDVAPVHDEFFDVENEVNSDAYEPMDIEESSTTPDISLTKLSEMHQLPTSPALPTMPNGSQTPDMQGLKHMFAEPPRLASESYMSDFRHMMRPDVASENDFSLASAWNTLTAEPEEHDGPWHDVSEEPVSLSPSQAGHESSDIGVPPNFLTCEENDHMGETNKVEASKKEEPRNLLRGAPQEASVTPGNMIATPETESANKYSAPVVSALAATPNLYPTERETTTGTSPPKSNYLKERTTNETVADPTGNNTDGQRTTSAASIPTKDIKTATSMPKETQTKIRAEAAVPVRMSPRRAAAQAQRAQTQAAQATRMAPRTVPQKEPYVPVRRRLPARAAVSNLGSMTTTATRASRTRAAVSEEQAHGPDVTASDTNGRRATGQTSSIPLAANGRRPTSTQTKNDVSSSKTGSFRGAGPRTARVGRSSRQV